jgi:hypothetical protein
MAIETDFGAETTTDRDYANVRNFYKVQLWTKDDQRVERLLHAGNRIDKAREVFAAAVKHRRPPTVRPPFKPQRPENWSLNCRLMNSPPRWFPDSG